MDKEDIKTGAWLGVRMAIIFIVYVVILFFGLIFISSFFN